MAQNVKSKLNDVFLYITWGKIANVYFDKGARWFYDRLNERDAEFTQDELLQLKGALVDLSERIRKAADAL
jgi:hypothetical protein